jgi:cation diffusion facilitator CzcD-associated flavoprotein CzcO
MDRRFERIKILKTEGLRSLEADVKRDLSRLNYPPRNWPLPVQGPDGKPVLDVLVVGGGMYGQTMAFALYREGIRNFRVIEKAPRGNEGPWGTYARMEILRSPKHQIGPDLGIPSLTFRAWLDAQNGSESWVDLYKIHRLDWLAYLLWVREVLDLPIENGRELISLSPAQNAPLSPVRDFIRAEIKSDNGVEVVFAREVVLATGREGTGKRHVPSFPSLKADAVGSGSVFHSADDIDFKAARGKAVAVLGANASAFDNSAVALENGAASVTMFCRRPFLPQVNKARWMGFSGFQHGFPSLGDEDRWRFSAFTSGIQMPPPHESVQRCLEHPGFTLLFGEPWEDVVADDSGVTIVTAKRRKFFDLAIFATGFGIDVGHRPELSPFRDEMALWQDRVSLDEAARHPQLARFPYLGPGFQFVEKRPGACPALSHLRAISYGAAMSYGALAGDIPGLAPAALQVSQSISRSLFLSDFDRYYLAMVQFEEPELEPTPFFVPVPERR